MMRVQLQKFCCRTRVLGVALVVVGGVMWPAQGWGTGVDLYMGSVFSGTPASGTPPWVEASFRDVSPGTVQLTITNLNIASAEKVTELYLNLNSNLNPVSLQFTFLSGSSGVTAPQPSLGVDGFKADGDGKYDIRFGFSQPPASAFSSADYLTYTITGIPTLTSSDFNYLSSPAGGHGPFVAAIHIQGINASGVGDTYSSSGWASASQIIVIPIPEPSSSVLLFAAASVALGGRAWRKRGRLV